MVLVVLLAVTSLGTGALFAARARVEGLGYNRQSELTSPLALAARDLEDGAGVASNDYPKLYWVSHRKSITVIPWTGYYFPKQRADRENQILLDRLSSGEVTYLAFFKTPATVRTPESLVQLGCDVSRLETYADGTLWRSGGCE